MKIKCASIDEFKSEVKKALLIRDTNVVVEYQSLTFRYCHDKQRWEIRENDLLHCEWGPAVFYSNGLQEWWCMGWRHRTDGPAILRPDGSEDWFQFGHLHRTDGPAQILSDGTQKWYCHHHLHRVDGPAVLRPDGTEEWWYVGEECRFDEIKREETEELNYRINSALLTGDRVAEISVASMNFKWYADACCWSTHYRNMIHRVGGPAIIRSDGTQEWYCMGNRHRSNGPAILRPDGSEEWWYMGHKHREGGPAVIKSDGEQNWWYMNLIHRVDGPAVIHPDGSEEWWQYGRRIK